MNTEDKLKLAKKAVGHVLNRIAGNKDISYHLGAATESFTLLTAAYAVLVEKTQEEVMEVVIRGSSRVPHQSPEEILEELNAKQADRDQANRTGPASPGSSAAATDAGGAR